MNPVIVKQFLLIHHQSLDQDQDQNRNQNENYIIRENNKIKFVARD